MDSRTICVDGKNITADKDMLLKDVADLCRDRYKNDIILALADGVLRELTQKVGDTDDINFITTESYVGMECYKRSCTLLMLKAMNEALGDKGKAAIEVMYSVSDGYYCELNSGDISPEVIPRAKEIMEDLVRRDVPILKKTVSRDAALKIFSEYGMEDKVLNMKYRRASSVNIYSLEGYVDYFYGYMAFSTGILKYFDLIPYSRGFVLQMPVVKSPEIVRNFAPDNKVFGVLMEAARWAKMMNCSTIGQVNEAITKGTINDIVLISEALQEKKIGEIASMVSDKKEVKFVMIAGPSSSGKTTFSNRLAVQLRALGYNALLVPMDNYFVDRRDNPVDEDGNLDFETVEAIDVEFFNDQMNRLISGERVEMPEFNFFVGKREFHGNYLKLKENDILIIEGIHGLNDAVTYRLPAEKKFKIYINALTPLNVDEHNRIATSDWRLIRRIARDVRTRGNSARDTIEMWNRVRRGEKQNIYPYQETADVIFNSAMVYELAVLKNFVEPALFRVEKDTPEYLEASKLLKFMDYILGIPADYIPSNSIVREFTGGGIFKV